MAIKGEKSRIGLLLSGQEVIIPNADLFITQPSIKQIVTFGEDDFLQAVSLLVNLKTLIFKLKEGNSGLEQYSDFQLLMTVLSEDMSVQNLIQNLFELIFPEYKIQITSNFINFSIYDEESKENHFVGQIHPYNFEDFQALLSDLFLPQKTEEEEKLDYNPVNDVAAKIAEKLKKGREKISELKGEKGQSLFANYCSVLSIGLSMDVNILYNYTPFQLYDAYRRYIDKQASDFYLRVSSMPFMEVSDENRPKEWTRHLY